MAQVIQHPKEDLHMNDFVPLLEWDSSLIFVFNLIQSQFFLTRFLTHHLREQYVIPQFPF